MALYRKTDSALVPPQSHVFRDLNRLVQYWHCFPDVYFRMGMLLKGYTEWLQMISFLPQLAFSRYERRKIHYLDYANLLRNKIIFNDLLTFNAIPVPSVLFCYRNGRFFAKGGLEISDNLVNGILSDSTVCRIFAKKAIGRCGAGVTVYTKRGQDYYAISGEIVDALYIRGACGTDDYHFEEGSVKIVYYHSFALILSIQSELLQ